MNKIKFILLMIFVGLTIGLFQNCSEVNFGTKKNSDDVNGILNTAPQPNGTENLDQAGNEISTSGEEVATGGNGAGNNTSVGSNGTDATNGNNGNGGVILDTGTVVGGLTGGHFDIDTATALYQFGAGENDSHVHDYDVINQVTYADLFNLYSSKEISIPDVLDSDAKFIIVVGNASLSPGAYLQINGQTMLATEYNNNTLTEYSLDGGGSSIQLTDLQIKFTTDVLQSFGLVAGVSGCVKRNNEGPNGEYRDGALVVQLIKVDNQTAISATTGTAELSSNLLWETAIFWHDTTLKCAK